MARKSSAAAVAVAEPTVSNVETVGQQADLVEAVASAEANDNVRDNSDAGDRESRQEIPATPSKGQDTRNDIAARVSRARRKERGEEVEDDDNVDRDADSPGKDDEVDPVETKTDDQPEAKSQDAVDNSKPAASEEPEITLLVDGKEVRKTLKEVTALAQQTIAGDNRLDTAKRHAEEAKEAAEAAKRLLAEVEARASRGSETGHPPGQNDKTQQSAKPDPGHQPALSADPEKYRGIVSRIQVGDEDEGAKALAELVQDAVKQTMEEVNREGAKLSPEEWNRRIDDRVAENAVNSAVKGAIDKFGTDHKELVADPLYSSAVFTAVRMEMEKDIKAAGITDAQFEPFKGDVQATAKLFQHLQTQGHLKRDMGVLLDTVGTTLKTKFGIAKPVEPAPVTPSHTAKPSADSKAQSRIDAKRSAPQQPRSATVRVDLQQSKKPKTTQEILADMRKSRGQQVLR
jgi:hypothetical protein